jgi:uncharacterized protein YneF (UPF0154 family)
MKIDSLLSILFAVMLGLYVCRNFTEKYLSRNMKVIINNIKKKEREGVLGN